MSIGTIQADGLLTGYGGIPTHNFVTTLCASNSAILTRVFELPVTNSRAVHPGSLSGESSGKIQQGVSVLFAVTHIILWKWDEESSNKFHHIIIHINELQYYCIRCFANHSVLKLRRKNRPNEKIFVSHSKTLV